MKISRIKTVIEYLVRYINKSVLKFTSILSLLLLLVSLCSKLIRNVTISYQYFVNIFISICFWASIYLIIKRWVLFSSRFKYFELDKYFSFIALLILLLIIPIAIGFLFILDSPFDIFIFALPWFVVYSSASYNVFLDRDQR